MAWQVADCGLCIGRGFRGNAGGLFRGGCFGGPGWNAFGGGGLAGGGRRLLRQGRSSRAGFRFGRFDDGFLAVSKIPLANSITWPS